MTDQSAERSLVVVINDLIFETKIRSTAEALGVRVTILRSTSLLVGELDRLRPSLLVVDLNTAGADAVQAVATGCTHPSKPHVIAYVSHVDEDLARRAAAAGAQQVMPRSRFNTELPRLLASYCGRTS